MIERKACDVVDEDRTPGLELENVHRFHSALESQESKQGALGDSLFVPFGLLGVASVVVNPVCVESKRRVSEKQSRGDYDRSCSVGSRLPWRWCRLGRVR